LPESRKEPKSKYTADRNIPGAFEGETVTRRRFMTLTTHAAGGIATAAVLLPVLGFAAGSAIFERAPVIWTPIGKPEDFPDDNYIPRVVTLTQGIGEVGKATVYVRRFNPEFDAQEGMPAPPETDAPVIALSSRCMHLRRVRLRRRRGRRPAGTPARSLLHPHAQRSGRSRPALLGQLGVQALPELP
jgi:menaquinol-cytochrome c reductase iron-sulfur subunit